MLRVTFCLTQLDSAWSYVWHSFLQVFDRLTHEHNFTGAHRAKLESGAQEEFLLRSFLHGSFD